jgi:hypothetical protein
MATKTKTKTKAQQGAALKKGRPKLNLPDSVKSNVRNAFKKFDNAPKSTAASNIANTGKGSRAAAEAVRKATRNKAFDLSNNSPHSLKQKAIQGKNLAKLAGKTVAKQAATKGPLAMLGLAGLAVGTGLSIKDARKTGRALADAEKPKRKTHNTARLNEAMKKKPAGSAKKGGSVAKKPVAKKPAPKVTPVRTIKKTPVNRVNQENRRRANTATAKATAANSFKKAKAAKAARSKAKPSVKKVVKQVVASRPKPKATNKAARRGSKPVRVRKNVTIPKSQKNKKRRGPRREKA